MNQALIIPYTFSMRMGSLRMSFAWPEDRDDAIEEVRFAVAHVDRIDKMGLALRIDNATVSDAKRARVASVDATSFVRFRNPAAWDAMTHWNRQRQAADEAAMLGPAIDAVLAEYEASPSATTWRPRTIKFQRATYAEYAERRA